MWGIQGFLPFPSDSPGRPRNVWTESLASRRAPEGRRVFYLLLGLLIGAATALPLEAQVLAGPPDQREAPGDGTGVRLELEAPFTLEAILSPAFSYELVAARGADRIAWLVNERGVRNVYTAAEPDFVPVRLTITSRDDGVDLSNLQISEDGAVVVFVRGHAGNRDGWVANPSGDPRGGKREVWAAYTDGSREWRVAEAHDGIALSPDGRWVLQVAKGEVHRSPVVPGAQDGTEIGRPLFRVFGETRSPVWSPDQRRIAFVSDRDGHSYIGVYDVEERSVTYLSPGVDRDSAPTWSPNGSQIAFVRKPGLPFGGRAAIPEHIDRNEIPKGLLEGQLPGGATLAIWIADPLSGEGHELWGDGSDHPRFADIDRLHWADAHLVFESEPGNWRHYFSVSVTDPQPEPVHLTPGEGFVEMIDLPLGGPYLYYSTNVGDIDRRHLWRVLVDGERVAEQLTSGEGVETSPAVLSTGDRVAVLSAGASRPQSVALMPASGGELRLVGPEWPERFPSEHHVKPTNVVLTADDGVRFHNQLFLPPNLNPDERRPALIFIHGGPRRQMLLGYNYGHFYHMAYAVNQYFAAKGYVVLSVNFRRGIGYGRKFRESPNAREEGIEEYQDIRAAGLYLKDLPAVDSSRIALWGLSYGGTLTGQGLARDSDLFAAGIDIAGVHLFVDPRHEQPGVLDPGTVAYRSSSAPLVEHWRSPVLLVHGDDDRNVPFFQTAGLVQALRVHDVPYELIVFPDDVHSFLLHSRWLETFEAMDDFLDRVLIRGEDVAKGRERH